MTKNSPARRHHYLPQGYLAAFTKTGSKDGQFYVFDVNKRRSFSTSPINVAVERDFNRIDVEGKPIDAMEVALSSFEDQAIKAIRSVIQSENFPNDKNCNWILNILTLLIVRNPQRRRSFNRSREQQLHRIGDLLVSDKRTWDHHVKKAREAGANIDENISFDKVKDFVKKRKYRIEFSPGGNLQVEFNAFDKLLRILGERTWSVLVAPSDGPEFICSDHPVTLVWKSGKKGPVGYGLRETEVFFPLGRKVGLYGVFETPLQPVVQLRAEHVTMMNMRVALNAERHIYSTIESYFVWYGGKVREMQVSGTPAKPSQSPSQPF